MFFFVSEPNSLKILEEQTITVVIENLVILSKKIPTTKNSRSLNPKTDNVFQNVKDKVSKFKEYIYAYK